MNKYTLIVIDETSDVKLYQFKSLELLKDYKNYMRADLKNLSITPVDDHGLVWLCNIGKESVRGLE